MRARTVLILAILVAALAAFAWFVDRDRPGSDERRERADRLLSFESAEIRDVRIEGGDATVALERRAVSVDPEGAEEADGAGEDAADDEWWLRQPVEARADASAVDGLLNALSALDRQRQLEDAKPAEYGLEEPRWRLRLEGRAGTTEIAVGDEVPGLDSVAVSVDGAGVELVQSLWLDRLQPDGTGWRSPRLFHRPRDEIRSLRIEGATATVALERTDTGFRVVEPIQDLADRSLVDELLAAIVGLEAEEYVAEPELGEATRFETAFADGSLWILRLGADGAAIAGDEGVRIDEPALDEAAARSAEDWRSRALSPIDGYDVDAAVFNDSDGETHLEKVDGDWQRDGEPVGFSAATGPLYALADAEAEEFLRLQAAEDLQPMLEVSLTADGVTRQVALYERPGAEGCVGTVDDRDVALALPAGACDKVRDEVAAMRGAEAIGAPAVATQATDTEAPESTDDHDSPEADS